MPCRRRGAGAPRARTERGAPSSQPAGDPAARRLGLLGDLPGRACRSGSLVRAEQPRERGVDAAEASRRRRRSAMPVGESRKAWPEALGVGLVTLGDVARDDVAEAGGRVDRGADLGPAHVAARAGRRAGGTPARSARAAGGRLDEQAWTRSASAGSTSDHIEPPTTARSLGRPSNVAAAGLSARDRAVERRYDEGVACEVEKSPFERVVRDFAEVVHLCPLAEPTPPQDTTSGRSHPRVRIGTWPHKT